MLRCQRINEQELSFNLFGFIMRNELQFSYEDKNVLLACTGVEENLINKIALLNRWKETKGWNTLNFKIH